MAQLSTQYRSVRAGYLSPLAKVVNIASGQDLSPGMVGSLNASGELIAGLSSTQAMPLWLLRDPNLPSIAESTGNREYAFAGGAVEVLVGEGGYEIETDQYVDGTYNYNDALTAASGDDAGKVAVCTIGSDPIVGVVSAPPAANMYGQTVLTLWTTFLPVASGG